MREKGDVLEDLVSNLLGINKTTNSGAKWGNGDLTNRELMIECKVKSGNGFKACGPEVKKIIAEASKHNKDWMYIQSTDDGIYVLMDFNKFVENYYEKTK